ncbi:MAG TPA: hypothetical protein VE195_07905, partial [Acidobacteriaceae bacterium]|nr:hypothetical protein [Acidobacteriaceae bacterium]
MTIVGRKIVIAIAVISAGAMSDATDLTLHLKGSQAISHLTVKYECDAEGAKMGLPGHPFSVEYLN